MKWNINYRAILCALLIMPLCTISAVAQDEASEEHVKAVRELLKVTKFTNQFDTILPDISIALKRRLTSNQPQNSVEIDLIVDEEALLLAPRRGALETEAIKLITKAYSIEELNDMTEFFASDAGQKYLNGMPLVFKDLEKASRIWGAGIERDLSQNVVRRINETSQ